MWVLLAFVALGVGLLVGGAFTYRSTRAFLSTAVPAEGTVVAYAESRSSKGELTYYPVVAFTPRDGSKVEFQASSGGSSRGPVGERVAVLYDPRNPHRAEVHSFLALWLLCVLLLGLGLVFAGTGVVLLLAFGRRGWGLSRAEAERLRATGRRLTTTFQDAIVDRSTEVNGRSPYRIVTQWQDPTSGAVHVFESEPVWFNPRDYIPSAGIDVYIDPEDMTRYCMNTSFLPRLAGRG
jgi:hypothetical protein